jgi:hypothetical protein
VLKTSQPSTIVQLRLGILPSKTQQVYFEKGATSTGWPHTTQLVKADCRRPEAMPHR